MCVNTKTCYLVTTACQMIVKQNSLALESFISCMFLYRDNQQKYHLNGSFPCMVSNAKWQRFHVPCISATSDNNSCFFFFPVASDSKAS